MTSSLPARKARGAFYTCKTAADYMVRWAVRSRHDAVLEPSFGNGVFLEALTAQLEPDQVFGAEIDAATYQAVLSRGLLPAHHAHLGDFMQTEPGQAPFGRRFSAVVGNPPYVRLRTLPREAAQRALQVAEAVMGEPMSPSGSLWMPFLLQSCRFLAPGGRLALILPYELTYVQYARPLWRYLMRQFGSLRCIRVRDRIFPDISQDVVLLLADEFQGTTAHVTYETYDDLNRLLAESPIGATDIPVAEVVAGGRPFIAALLGPQLMSLLASPRVARRVIPLGDICRFTIGYVAGDKSFFHLSREAARARGIPPAHLRPTVTAGRDLKGVGIYTSALSADRQIYLYDPPADPKDLTAADRQYIAEGEDARVHERYKCRIRRPWYKVPGLEKPDILLSVFSNRPIMVQNDGGFLASNSLLCGRVADGVDPTMVISSWYNSLTLLSCETEIHSLGGGVMILIPGETNKVLVPRLWQLPKGYLAELDRLLRRPEGFDRAIALGDAVILERELSLARQEVALIRDGIATLRRWRTGA